MKNILDNLLKMNKFSKEKYLKFIGLSVDYALFNLSFFAFLFIYLFLLGIFKGLWSRNMMRKKNISGKQVNKMISTGLSCGLKNAGTDLRFSLKRITTWWEAFYIAYDITATDYRRGIENNPWIFTVYFGCNN